MTKLISSVVAVSTTLLLSLLGPSRAAAQSTVELVNNQSFDVRMPVRLRGVKIEPGIAADQAQQEGEDTIVIADVAANKTAQIGAAPVPDNVNAAVTLLPDAVGVGVVVAGKPMGRLSWGVVVHAAPDDKSKKKGEQAPSTKQDFAASFKAVDLKFSRTATGGLFEVWTATGADAGLKLDVTLLAYRSGFLDMNATVTNVSAPRENVYAAAICRWEQAGVASRSLCYDNRRQPLEDPGNSPFRSGEGRHLYVQRGADWVNSHFAEGGSALWLYDFTPSLTSHRPASVDSKGVKSPARWVGANGAQLGQEVQSAGGAVYSITEIARPNIKMYESRLEDNVLPGPDEALTITSRIAFCAKPLSDDAADQQFIAYTGYNAQESTPTGTRVSFGVPFTRMGTNYFPYSTLGENFGDLRMAGMSKEGYWPLAPQTVKQYKLFADDIKRDLRILKSMGFELVRLHHLELLYDNDPAGKPYITPAERWAYLDFLFAEIESLQLKALLDVKLPPADVVELATRYRKLVTGVEYDNEVLIFQVADEDVPVWKEVYSALKKATPEIPFSLTGHTNTGAFDRVAKEGATVDVFGQHAYLDGVEPIASSRDYALAYASYASKHGKPSQITEWNWRFLTRMPFEDRAKVYPPLFENVLAARCVPVMYQFQFQDSLAMNPTTLKGIRRYEPLLLSRRLKPEGAELSKLIERYGPPDSASGRIGVSHVEQEMKNNAAAVEFVVTNRTDKPIALTLSAETATGVQAELTGGARITLPAKGVATVPLKVSVDAAALPGFYHCFLRMQTDDGAIRYGWADIRQPGPPLIDKAVSVEVEYGPNALDFDFNRPLTVVYPDDASVMELEAAWTVFITLESATGRPVEIFQAGDLAKANRKTGAEILVTRKKGSKAAVQVAGDRLTIAGGNEQDVTKACMDFVVRYWKNAKDAGARKVGLIAAPKGEAGGKTDLE